MRSFYAESNSWNRGCDSLSELQFIDNEQSLLSSQLHPCRLSIRILACQLEELRTFLSASDTADI